MYSLAKINKVIAKISLLIGLPFALLCIAAVVTYLVLFPVPQELVFTEFDQYIIPAVIAVVLLIGSIISIRSAGKRLHGYVEREYSLFKSGQLFSFYVGSRLLFLVLILFAGIVYITNFWHTDPLFVEHVAWAIAVLLASFASVSFLGGVTIGIAASHAAKIIITSAKADLSLPEYAI